MSSTVINDTFQVKAASKVMGWVLLIIGLGLISLGAYVVVTLTTLGHALAGFGILLASSGGILLIKKNIFNIQVDQDNNQIIIIESTGKKKIPLKIPLNYYSSIVVLADLKGSGNNQARYEVVLMNSKGSSLLIRNFADKAGALDFGQSLQQFLRFDLVVDKIPFASDEDTTDSELNIELPEKSKLSESDSGNSKIYSWKSSGSVLNLLLLLLIVYGLFHAIIFAIVPHIDSMIVLIVMAGIGGIFGIIILTIVVSNLFRHSFLKVDNGQLTCYYTLFGLKFGEKKTAKQKIGMIKNSINAGDGSLTIISREGIHSINRLVASFTGGKRSLDFSLVSDLMSLKSEMILMNVSVLNAVEKFYLEQKILTSV